MIAEKLRKAVLKAAMEGKLTEQLASDGTSKDQLEPKLLKYIIKENSSNFEIPENWIYIKLKALIKLVSGRDLKTSEYNDKKNGIPYITGASNFFENSLLINRWTNNPKVISKKGDLLITVKGTIGLLNYNNIGDIHIARQIMAIKSTQINIDYLKYFLCQYVETLQKNAKSFIPGISRNDILDIVFPLPPRNEQKRIVEKLEVLLAEIDKLEKHEIELKELKDKFPKRLKDSVMLYAMSGRLTSQLDTDSSIKEIVTEKVLNNVEEVNQPWEIPLNWAWVKFSDLVDFKIGKTPDRSNSNYWGGDYPWISIADMNNRPTISKSKEKITKDALVKFYKNELVPRGTLIMSFKLTVGRTSILEIDAIHNEAIISIYPKKYAEIQKKYLYYVLPYMSNLGDTKDAIKGKTLNKRSISNLLIPLPPIEEQVRIVKKLEEFFKVKLINQN